MVEGEGALELVTDRLRLTYDRGPFTPAGLSVQARGDVSNYHSVWRYGEPAADLGGTARTLDVVDGRAPLEPGVVSRVGIGALDDSRSFLFTDDGWVSPRGTAATDLYVFAYGHDYDEALRAFYAVSGRQPLLPRWALGNWWSRYHRVHADSYLALLDRFDEDGLPFSVAVIDMDWHRVESVPEEHGSGWTGYSWEPSLFPDPEGFLRELHERGLRVTLNVHPADGVRAFEDAYPAMAEALGRDPATGEPIAFDLTDRAFLEAYFDVLHHGLEDQGVDFWWIDWQQGPHSRIPGIDPLWMLNHFHFLDSGRDGRRPLTFSRYAGPGSHRYPVGFSGDTVISWASLDFQPEFTATASNIGYGWWSHDVGGHLFGVRDDELATRWVQLGVFSPILRLHSSSNPFLVKEPWMYPARGARGDDRRAALPPPARALPAHDEPPRRRRGRAARAADVPPGSEGPARVRGPEPVRVRLRAARRPDHLAARPGDPARAGARLAPGRRVDRRVHRHRLRRRPRDRAAPRRPHHPRAAARRRHPAADGPRRPRRHPQPRAARAAGRAGRRRLVHAGRGRRHGRDARGGAGGADDDRLGPGGGRADDRGARRPARRACPPCARGRSPSSAWTATARR